jgi:molybdopterin/thiamine biosynthesis adenylyltransferase
VITAQQKNQSAIKHLIGNEALSNRLMDKRIAIISPPESEKKRSACLIAEGLGDLIGRLWKKIDYSGPLSGILSEAIRSAAASGRQVVNLKETWEPPYDYVIGISADIPSTSGPGLKIGASGWNMTIGSKAVIDENPNPVGPLAAACLAAAEAFKSIFNDALADRCKMLPSDYFWSSWYGEAGHQTTLSSNFDLNMDDVHIFGVGSVTHSLVWLLERWPGKVSGNLYLIDHDSYDESNGQRYIGMRNEDIGKPKTEVVEKCLARKHSSLVVKGNNLDMNRYFTETRSDYKVNLAVSGLDSIEGRRQLQLKLPKCIVDMWTSGESVGACRYKFQDNWPCVFCIHPDNLSSVTDEVAEIFRETGIAPARIRALLNSGQGLSENDANAVAPRYQIDKNSIIGKPLRTVRGQLCATGKLVLPNESIEADVPLAFAAGLAGIGGFIELARELWQIPMSPGHWVISTFMYPTEWNWTTRQKVANCYLCSDSSLAGLLEKKYLP